MICQTSWCKMAVVKSKAACWLSGSPPVLQTKVPLTCVQCKAVTLSATARCACTLCWGLLLTSCLPLREASSWQLHVAFLVQEDPWGLTSCCPWGHWGGRRSRGEGMKAHLVWAEGRINENMLAMALPSLVEDEPLLPNFFKWWGRFFKKGQSYSWLGVVLWER